MAGRRAKHTIDTPEEFRKLAQAYFTDREKEERPITYTGLILALGFSSYCGFHIQAKREGFSEVVNWAKMHVIERYERRLHGPSPSGAIFAMQNFKDIDGSRQWRNRIEQEVVDPMRGASEKEIRKKVQEYLNKMPRSQRELPNDPSMIVEH